MRPAARDFVADAVAHRKFIGHVEAASILLEKAGAADCIDDGFVPLKDAKSCDAFITQCRKLRFWDRVAAER